MFNSTSALSSVTNSPNILLLIAFFAALIVSASLTPLMRKVAILFSILDKPSSNIKTHREPVPYLGGVAIWAGWLASLLFIRLFTHFPTGTLKNLRGIILGSIIVLCLGLWDDIVPKGIGFKKKFFVQFLAAIWLFNFDIRLHFVSPYLLAILFSVIWTVGVTNAFNIIDIMDGLASGVAVIACLAFLVIALPSEQIYVNFTACALAGAALGFIPFNLSKKYKIFMGDTGSITIGFILAALSMGTSYTRLNEVGLFAPLLILAIPIYDTALVMFIRSRKGISPFLGSKDHFALRLEAMGFSRPNILAITYSASIILATGAYLVTRLQYLYALLLFLCIALSALWISYILGKVEVK